MICADRRVFASRDPDSRYDRFVANVRGADLLDVEAFVRETHGPVAVERVREALGEPLRVMFRRSIREADWYPLDVLKSYLTTAKALLEPGSSDFFRREGHFAAQRRRQGPLEPMVGTPERRAHFARVVWHMFYDTGWLEVVGDSPETAFARIHGFPASPELCERFRGIWEGMAGGPFRAEEWRCVLRGDPYCELHLVPA